MNKHRCIIISFLWLFTNCGEGSKVEMPSKDIRSSSDVEKLEEEQLSGPEFSTGNLTYELTENDLGFGYIIKADSQAIIIQNHVPGVQGMIGFKSEKDAKKVAGMVVYKLNNEIMPPSVTLEELDSLNIEY